jgi:hypothetical protein
MKPAFKRTRLWVDPPFQARLLLRMGAYLALYILVVLHVGFFLELMRDLATNGPVKNFGELYLDYAGKQAPLLIALLLMMPPLLYNLLKFSHRIAGPLFRCRRVMQEMAAGQVVPEFKPRVGDLMRELFAAFNELIRTSNARAKERTGAAPAAGEPAAASAPVNEQQITEKIRV